MAEPRSRRLRVVLQVAEREEQEAAAHLGEARRQLDREGEQLSQLEDYRDQYVQEYQALGRGVDARALISYSGFLQRLGAAVSGQQEALARARRGLEARREQWQQVYHRRRSLAEMIERLEREEEAERERRQQREQDDLAGQRQARPGRKF